MFTEAGGDEGHAAGDESAGEEPRRRDLQVRRHRAARRAEEPSGAAAEVVRSLHDMLHLRHHRQPERRDADTREHHGVQCIGDNADGRSWAHVQGCDDQLPPVGAHVGALLREQHVHDGRFGRLLQR